jgi:hypothetical protein
VPFTYILFNDQLEVGTKGMLAKNKLAKNKKKFLFFVG